MSSTGTSGAPQFEKVEYTAGPGNCVLCNQPIGGTYYRVNGSQACASCVERERSGQRTAAAHYPRALVFGIGAAIAGMIGYAVFEIATGWIIGYVSLGVGWLVGTAMLKGSKGFGGRRYQITAAILTYMAVSLAAIPVAISQYSKQHPKPAAIQQVAPPPVSSQTPGSPDAGNAPSITVEDDSQKAESADPAANETPNVAKPKMNPARALGALFVLGLASPFLELADPFHGLIGLVILFVGIRIAWKMTARPPLVIDGPF